MSPQRSEKRQRQELVGLRLTTQEKADVKAHAVAAGLTIVGLIRVQLGLDVVNPQKPKPATVTVQLDGLADQIARCVQMSLDDDITTKGTVAFSEYFGNRASVDLLALLQALAVSP